MGEKSYLKGYAKALDPNVRTKHKSKSWLRGFIDATERANNCCKGKSIFSNNCNSNKISNCDNNYNNYPEEKIDNNMLYMFNSIINNIINLIQQAISGNSTIQNPIQNYSNYNNTVNQNVANVLYDNDIVNTNVNGINNSIFIDA